MRKFALIILFLGSRLLAADFIPFMEGVRTDYWFRFLGFYVKSDFVLRDVGYTTNIYRYSTGAESDWVAEPSLKLRLSGILWNRFILQFGGEPSYAFFLNHPGENSWNHTLSADLYTYIGSINLNGQWSKSSKREFPTSEFGVRVRFFSEGGSLGLEWGRQDALFLGLSAESRDLRFEDERYLDEFNLSQLLDRREVRYGLRLNKVIFTSTLLFLGFDWEKFRFVRSPQRDADSRKYYLGVRFPGSGALTGSLQFGMREFLPLEGNQLPPLTFFGQGEFALKMFGRIKLRGDYLADRNYSVFGENLLFNQKSLGLGIDLYLLHWLKTGARYSITRNTYQSVLDAGEDRWSDFYQASFSLGFRISGRTTLNIVYTYYSGGASESRFNRGYSFIGGSISNEF